MAILRTTAPSGQFLTLANDSWVGHSIREYGEWSFGEIQMLSQFIGSHDNMIEVGSNIGSHTVFIARDICPQGQVFAFEPRRIVFQLLCGNIALNGLTNVHAHQLGIGDKRETIAEAPLPLEQAANIGAFAVGSIKGVGERLNLIHLDAMLETLPHIRAIKADVEGYEINLLRGARKLIRRDRPFLYLENDRPDKSEKLLTFISSLGYHIYWHITSLYRPGNFAENPVNHFKNIASFNILCIPQEHGSAWELTDAEPISDFKHHPLAG